MGYERRRRFGVVGILLLVGLIYALYTILNPDSRNIDEQQVVSTQLKQLYNDASQQIATIPVKGRAPKTGYERAQFGEGWVTTNGCDTRNIILNRDMTNTEVDQNCLVISGVLDDPYSGETINFKRGADTSDDVQIDHVVALSDAWQKGAQQISYESRVEFANDPLNLLAVSGPLNQQKSDSDAASWLPPNKPFRCQYVSRQVLVKVKYDLWFTTAEKDTIVKILSRCTN